MTKISHFLLKGPDQKQPRKGGDIIFPIISQQGLSVAMETRVLIQSAPKPYAAPPPPMMLHIKFDQDKLTGFRGIQVAGNEDMHKISDEFEFRSDRTTHYGVSCP